MANLCDYEGRIKCPKGFTESEIEELKKIVHEEMEYDGESYIEVNNDKTFVKIYGCFWWSGVAHHDGEWVKTLFQFLYNTKSIGEIWTNECGCEFSEHFDFTYILKPGGAVETSCYYYEEVCLGDIVESGEEEFCEEDLEGTILEGYSFEELSELYKITDDEGYYYRYSPAWELGKDRIYYPPFKVKETTEEASEPDTYDKYILKWMVDHDHSIIELKNKLNELYLECIYNDDDYVRAEFAELSYQEQWDYIWKMFLDEGFDGEIWACYDEWKNNEKGEK